MQCDIDMPRKKYFEMKIYLKDEDTFKNFKHYIVDFGTADNAIKSLILAYKTNPSFFKPRFI